MKTQRITTGHYEFKHHGHLVEVMRIGPEYTGGAAHWNIAIDGVWDESTSTKWEAVEAGRRMAEGLHAYA